MENTIEVASVEPIPDGCIADVGEPSNLEMDENLSNPPPIPSTSSGQSNRPRLTRRNGRSEEAALQHDVLLSVQQHFKRPATIDDRFDVYGKNVAMKLRDLPQEQRIMAEKIINDTLFVVEMGKLNMAHTQIYQQNVVATNTPTRTPTHTPTPTPTQTPTPALSPIPYQPRIYPYETSTYYSPMQQYQYPEPCHYNPATLNATTHQLSSPEDSAGPFILNLNNNNNDNNHINNNIPNYKNNCNHNNDNNYRR